MKLFITFLIFISCTYWAQSQPILTGKSPLSFFSKEWENEKYLKCNTAEEVTYMNDKEKEVIYIINLARSYPRLFLNTVVNKYPESVGKKELKNEVNYQTLLNFLKEQDSLNILYPDSLCFVSALCLAKEAGKSGYTGHDRKSKECIQKRYFNGECCEYGSETALDIVMYLLIDIGVFDAAHRELLYGPFTKVGVSFQPHKKYKFNTVIDLLQ